MSLVSFDGQYIFSDSICVTSNEFQLIAHKVLAHHRKNGEGTLVSFFVGSLGLGTALTQEVFDCYESDHYAHRFAFGTKLNIPDKLHVELFIVDMYNGFMFLYDNFTQSFARVPIQPVTIGFDLGVAVTVKGRSEGATWSKIASDLEALSNAPTTNARFTSPPYTVFDVEANTKVVVLA